MTNMKALERWQDWTSFGLGLWLAVSPWVAGFHQHEAPTVNCVFIGLVVALAAHFECTLDDCTAEWLNLALGAWLVAAPFAFNFTHLAIPAANCIAGGLLVSALAASALSLDKEIAKLLGFHRGKEAR
jgi:hypothetical protein